MKTNGNAFTTAQATGSPERAYPLPDYPDHYTITREMMIFASSYTGPPLDEADSVYTSAYCVADTSYKTQGPILRFDRVWATVPEARDVVEARSVTFPAFGTSTTSAGYSLVDDGAVAYQLFSDFQPRSATLTLTVPARRHVEHVLPGVVGASSIDELPRQVRFRVTDSAGTTVANLEASGATPSVATYKAWIATGTEIVVSATNISKYLGNIWRAETVYAKAH